ncbi:MAG TPA: hypothetical protein VEM96_19055 [Pyrinomonadaceae bacterium]|nr:hypothetical protein [Pyrinomonadaceae bacterium]
MKGNITLISFVFIVLVLTCPVLSQDQPKPKETVGEGVVVAFQKKMRYPVKPYTRGLGTFAEFWIVRMDKWEDETRNDKKYLLVEFNLYERGLTDCEINAKKLQFTLRERRENEHTDCTGSTFKSSDSNETRPAELSDYERTKPGKLEELPPLKSLPCLIADKPPIVIE